MSVANFLPLTTYHEFSPLKWLTEQDRFVVRCFDAARFGSLSRRHSRWPARNHCETRPIPSYRCREVESHRVGDAEFRYRLLYVRLLFLNVGFRRMDADDTEA